MLERTDRPTIAANVAGLRRRHAPGTAWSYTAFLAMAPIDKVIITPHNPPGIEVVGHLMAMLEAAGAFSNDADTTSSDLVSALS